VPATIEQRAAVYAALADPMRLRIVDELAASDRSPRELAAWLEMAPNLLAHHLDVLEGAGLVSRSHSSGDGRRRYVRLRAAALDGLWRPPRIEPQPALFVCSQNSARSQLAAALWRRETNCAGSSAGTHPARRVHRGAMDAAARAGLDLGDAVPRRIEEVAERPALTVTVCDRAHEGLAGSERWLHWSIPDPVESRTAEAFDEVLAELCRRMRLLLGTPE
jgi:protein-tyrosine-phosphatase